ncbi:TIGR03118 family protein [Rhodocytophaga rosea]|uniref:TIGR03118 family protein n=1 Tax=Rhodocytophaga rosea TaxID=2704465 RepID=A0A6C0GTD6_9BACT|nr:TIGR03118 family protein [Rhodocytophaga rosea]QHT70793.1 TIGR03118 family protein [Rhodocytophaga rosea]
MLNKFLSRKKITWSVMAVWAMVLLASCDKIDDYFPRPGGSKGDLGNLKQINLVANKSIYKAKRVDPVLLNAWGLAFSITGAPWISAPGAGVTTIYDADGNAAHPALNIPSPSGPAGGLVTGQVANHVTASFLLSNGVGASFIFVGLDGILSAWNPAMKTNIEVVKNNVGQAAYTGLALSHGPDGSYLFAANVIKGTVDVFDWAFRPVTDRPFKDPNLPAGYLPFNIHAVEDYLLVTYSKVGPNGRPLKEVGNGIVNVFTRKGMLVKRFASEGKLNAPWGVAPVPASFFAAGKGQPAILIGNFGDGKINAYTPDGKFISQLKVNNKVVAIDGLWEITLPPAKSIIDQNRLYFTAGPSDEQDGLFGYLIK